MSMKNISNIKGYEFIKNCTKVNGYERCGVNLRFVVKTSMSDSIDGIVEVTDDMSYETYEALCEKYTLEDGYIVWGGEVVGNEIRYYWS